MSTKKSQMFQRASYMSVHGTIQYPDHRPRPSVANFMEIRKGWCVGQMDGCVRGSRFFTESEHNARMWYPMLRTTPHFLFLDGGYEGGVDENTIVKRLVRLVHVVGEFFTVAEKI